MFSAPRPYHTARHTGGPRRRTPKKSALGSSALSGAGCAGVPSAFATSIFVVSVCTGVNSIRIRRFRSCGAKLLKVFAREGNKSEHPFTLSSKPAPGKTLRRGIL